MRSLAYEDVHLVSEDGTKLHGWLMTSGSKNYKDKDTIVFLHENAGNIGLRLDYFEHVCNNIGCNILSVAYRGYSKSEGMPSEEGLQMDGRAIADFCAKTALFDNERVFLLGRSLGGAVAVHILVDSARVFKGAIIENTFTGIS